MPQEITDIDVANKWFVVSDQGVHAVDEDREEIFAWVRRECPDGREDVEGIFEKSGDGYYKRIQNEYVKYLDYYVGTYSTLARANSKWEQAIHVWAKEPYRVE